MDPISEFLLLAALTFGVPALGLRLLCGAITRGIAGWAPDRPEPSAPRYELVQVIPQATRTR